MTTGTSSDQKTALLLPGRRYSVDHPALYYVAKVARDLGWRTEAVEWDPDDVSVDAVIARGRVALRSLPSRDSVVIGKSLGSLLLPDVVAMGLPAIWLTPLLMREELRVAVARESAPTLLVGGSRDDLWDSRLAHATGHVVLELEGGDHSLELAGDAIGSARFLVTLTQHAQDFLSALGQRTAR
jgi:hypothetical protein